MILRKILEVLRRAENNLVSLEEKKLVEKRIDLKTLIKKLYQRKKIKVKVPQLEVGEEVLILAAQLKKKDSPRKFYKCSDDNKSYFHKQETFLITNRQKNDGKCLYWLKS